MIKKLSCALLLSCITILAAAQTGSVRGFIYDKESGEPVLFTPVALVGTSFAVSTDVNGFYAITKIPPGSYRLIATAPGYDSTSIAIVIEKDKVLSKQL